MLQTKEVHVVFGTGPAGSTLAALLLGQGKYVRCVNRSGKADLPVGIEVRAGNMLEQESVTELCKDAAVVYHCANVHYAQQVELLPLFQKHILNAAASAAARIVVLDTLYVYGRTHGFPMNSGTPHAAVSRKGILRKQMAETYLQAHAEGKLQVTLGRAADFFGPRVLNSALGDRVFPAALQGKPLQLIGNLDLPHSYSYIEDVAQGLATLGEQDKALGRAWLLPVAAPLTQRAVAILIGKLLERKVKTMALPAWVIHILGLGDLFMREFIEMFYQYTEPQVVDASEYEQCFNQRATPMDAALGKTLDWYRKKVIVA